MASYIAGAIGNKKGRALADPAWFVLGENGWLTFPKPPPANQSQEAGTQK
jgi:hypothetical protein